MSLVHVVGLVLLVRKDLRDESVTRVTKAHLALADQQVPLAVMVLKAMLEPKALAVLKAHQELAASLV